MIKLFLSIAALIAVAAGFAWLVDHPGTVTFAFANTEVETTMVVAAAAVVGIMVAFSFLWTIIRTIWRSPHILAGYFSARKRDKGYAALSTGLIAVGEGDPKRAHKAAQDANRLLANAPLALLLQAQAAQLNGDYDTARRTFHTMVDDPETRLLGLRGLFMEAERTNEPSIALQLALNAMEEAGKHMGRPGNEATVAGWAGPAVLRYQSAGEDWDGALRTISANQAAGLIDRKQAKRQRAIVLVAKAQNLEDGAPQEAKIAALEAHKLAPDLIPAAVTAGRLLSRLGELRRAVKTLETTWKHAPHPEIAETYAHIRPGDGPRERVKRIKNLIKGSSTDLESAIALSKAALDAQDWATARAALRPHLNQPSQRACLLMADLEEGEHGDKGRVREWLSKAVYAAPDPVWIADGAVSDHWAPISPRTGLLDAYEWRVPETALSRAAVTLSDEDGLLTPLPMRDDPPEPEPSETSPRGPEPITKPPEGPVTPQATLGAPTRPKTTSAPAPNEANDDRGADPKQDDKEPTQSQPIEEITQNKIAASRVAQEKQDGTSTTSTQSDGTNPPRQDKLEQTSDRGDEKPVFVTSDDLPRAPDDPGPDHANVDGEAPDNKAFRMF